MQCLHCQHGNPEGARFCNACGTQLEAVCPACGHVNPSESRFCNACGHNLFDPTLQPTQPEPQQATPVEPPPAVLYTPEAERRQLTVMFCDVADSTSIASRATWRWPSLPMTMPRPRPGSATLSISPVNSRRNPSSCELPCA